jgi:hypothetical protein
MRRLKELENAVPAVLEDREATAVVTACELWLDRPDLAFRHLSRVLEVEVGSYDQISTGECQVLLVRAAADLAASGVERRSDLGRQVHQLLRGADPTETPGEAQRAHRAARAAELSRLAARPRPDLWVAAVKEWDTIGRLFEASYARWRGAQAALATGHGTLANRLLQRAAKEARDHIPLAQAIRETQQGLQRVKEGSALSS